MRLFVVYPGVTHAFDIQTSIVYMGHVLDYDPGATSNARRRVLEFLRTRLKESPSVRRN